MRPYKIGQVAKFHTPMVDENPDQLYVVLEIKENGERSRVDIKALNTGFSFPPIYTVLLNDLEIVEVSTSDLLGHSVTINKSNCSQVFGKVVEVKEQKINLDLTKRMSGVETNVWLTIQDHHGEVHSGNLFVK